MPLRQRGGQPIPLRHPHLRWLRRRLSGLRQHLCHSTLYPHPLKWIPLHLCHPLRPPMADGPTPAIAGSLAPLVYAEDFIEGGRWWGGGALAG